MTNERMNKAKGYLGWDEMGWCEGNEGLRGANYVHTHSHTLEKPKLFTLIVMRRLNRQTKSSSSTFAKC